MYLQGVKNRYQINFIYRETQVFWKKAQLAPYFKKPNENSHNTK